MNKENFPDKCPECKSESLDFGDIDNFGTNGVKQKIECLDCGKTFTEYFKSVGWD